MYIYQTKVKTDNKHMVKLFLVVVGLFIGFTCGMWFASRVFPLSTSETIYLRGVEG